MFGSLSKRIIRIGAILLIFSLPYTCLLLYFLGEAKQLDRIGYSYVAADEPCDHPLSDVQLSRTIIADKESVSLRVVLSNDGSEECKAEVSIGAPNFEIEPLQPTRELTVPIGENTANLVWVLTPKEKGVQEIGIQAGLDVQTKGVSVTNILGLTPKQAQLLSYVGTFLGAPITLARLYSLLQKFQTERRNKKEEEHKTQEAQRKSRQLPFFSLITRLRNRK